MGIVLGARLDGLLDMLAAFECVADIGCDHGRLSVALLQREKALRVIACDISAPSLEKARALSVLCGAGEKISLRLGDGLACLKQNEADALVIAGMGGALIARFLKNSEAVARSAKRIVMQPMRGAAELRRFLYENGYRIESERLVFEAGRYYQLIAASSGTPGEIPNGFPPDYYGFGVLMAQNRDPLLLPLLNRYKAGHLKRLDRAKRKGVVPGALVKELDALDALLRFTEEQA